MPPILLLHLSDLHFGPHSRFQGDKPEKLGKSFHRSLVAAQKQLGAERKVDLVFVTGDFAETGLQSEFGDANRFLTALAGELGLPHEKFAFVPGNHDVNWDACQAAYFIARKGGRTSESELRAAIDGAKFEFYDEFVRSFYGEYDPREPLPRNAFLYRFEEVRLAVAALNSCEKESHRGSDHIGEVSEEQAQAALDALRRSDLKGWMKVVAVHHNPVGTTPANLDWWRGELLKVGAIETDLLARFESDVIGLHGHERIESLVADAQAQLVLHGHHHAKDSKPWLWRAHGHAHVLSAGSMWLQPEKLPKEEPASARLILLEPEVPRINAWSLVFTSWARTEGEVERGAFTLDPAGSTGFPQRLDFPEGFELAAAERKATEVEITPIDSEFLDTFRLRFADQYAPWDLGSLGVMRPGSIRGAKEARLDDMYLELRFDPQLNPQKTDAGKPLRVEDLLKQVKPLALTGTAGAGKTTWARYTFRQLIRDERTLPIMLVLRDVARNWQQQGTEGEKRSIDAALDDWIGAQMGRRWKGRLARAIKYSKGTRPILLVDGWDELGPLGETFRDKLMGFLHAHPRILAVVISRPYGEKRPSQAEGFEKLEVQPLSDADVKAMTRNFFGRFSGAEASDQKADPFLSALERSPEARALANTPLLLTMMLLVGYSQPLPDKRHLLYAQGTDTLLHNRPEQKSMEGALAGPHTWCPAGLDTRRRWAAALAYRAQTEGYSAIKGEVRAPVVRSWKEMKSFLPAECPVESRESFLAWLVEIAGLLVERTDDTLAFTHLGFQEYLTALYLETTAADHDQRLAAFQGRVGKIHWWETLRLLAARIDGANPEFLEIALRALLADPEVPAGTLSFLGTVLADGLGNDSLFRNWSRRYLPLLTPGWPEKADLCARAWLGTRQDERKHSLAREISEFASAQNWLVWLRCEMLGRGWATFSVAAFRATTRGLIGAIEGTQDFGREEVAAGRILVGSHPLWPRENHEIGWLHLWPTQRRLAGLRLQSAAAAGAPRESLVALARKEFVPAVEDERSRDWDRSWDRWDRWDRWNRWDRDWARDWPRYLARFWDRDWARFWVRDWVHSWADQLNFTPRPDWLKNFALTEVYSVGRSAARGLLARSEARDDPTFRLLAEAARLSIYSKHRPVLDLACDPQGIPPLWPALARHIARMSTPEDKALLNTLARAGGDGYSEPLRWGLQFIVRGDVLLDDGSVITLDELADEAGVPRLPYLEEMDTELEVA